MRSWRRRGARRLRRRTGARRRRKSRLCVAVSDTAFVATGVRRLRRRGKGRSVPRRSKPRGHNRSTPVQHGGGREPVGKTQVGAGRAQRASVSEHANGRTTPPAERGSWHIVGGFKRHPPKMRHVPLTHRSGNHCSAMALAIPGNVLERFFAFRELYTHDFLPVAQSVGNSGVRPLNHRSVRF